LRTFFRSSLSRKVLKFILVSPHLSITYCYIFVTARKGEAERLISAASVKAVKNDTGDEAALTVGKLAGAAILNREKRYAVV
jgi:hypothetical protein